MPPNPIQNETAPAAPKLEVPISRLPYGYTLIPATRIVEEDGGERIELIPGAYEKRFSHEPRTIILSAPRRGGHWSRFVPAEGKELTPRQAKRMNQCKPTRYIVWSDRSLRRVDKVVRKQLAAMTPAEQHALVAQAAQLGERKAA